LKTIAKLGRVVCIVAAAISSTPHSASHAQGVPLPGLSLVWSKNVGGLRSFSLSPHAHRLSLLTDEGKLALWTAQDANPIWATGNQTASNVLVSDGDGVVLTYNALALLATTATLRKADSGAVIWSKTFNAAIWAATFSPDGTNLAIGAGDDSLYLFDLASDEAQTTVSLTGTPLSIAFGPNNTSIFVGQWDESGIACLDLTGHTKWLDKGEMDRRYEIGSVGPRFVTYIGSSNRHGRSPTVYVVRGSTGQALWTYSLDDDSYNAAAATIDTAGLTGISYTRPRQIGSHSVNEQRLTSIDRTGQMQWEKGGLFWAPKLICITPDQSGLVVYDGKRKLYRLDSQGRTVATAVLSDELRKWSVSADNTSLVVYTHDGQMSLLHIQ
jgi:outer membrane protein assembly factor BamB